MSLFDTSKFTQALPNKTLLGTAVVHEDSTVLNARLAHRRTVPMNGCQICLPHDSASWGAAAGEITQPQMVVRDLNGQGQHGALGSGLGQQPGLSLGSCVILNRLLKLRFLQMQSEV